MRLGLAFCRDKKPELISTDLVFLSHKPQPPRGAPGRAGAAVPAVLPRLCRPWCRGSSRAVPRRGHQAGFGGCLQQRSPFRTVRPRQQQPGCFWPRSTAARSLPRPGHSPPRPGHRPCRSPRHPGAAPGRALRSGDAYTTATSGTGTQVFI